MYSLSANYLASHVNEVLELAGADEVLVILDSSDNLMIMKESSWRALQDIAHLFATPLNAERLQQSLQQVRDDYLVESNIA